MSPPRPSATDRHDTDVDLMILCLGSRGDVQPFLNLACHAAQTKGWRVVVACDGGYRALVEAAAARLPPTSKSKGAVLHAPLGGSFTEAMRRTPAGRALREARSLKTALAAAEAFFSPLAQVWARDVRRLCREHRPRVLLHSTFTFFAAFAAPFYASADCRRLHPSESDERHHYTPRVAVAHTVPSHATSAFLPPTTGQGLDAGWLGRAFLHRLAWKLGFAGAHRAVYVPLTRAAGEELMRDEGEGEDGGGGGAPVVAPALPTWQDTELLSPTPTFYVWSPSLVPRPEDWPETAQIVGAQLTAAQEEEEKEEPKKGGSEEALLPADLRALLASARLAKRPVVFATLGSMLGAVLEGPEAQRALEALVEGAGEAAVEAAADNGARFPPPVVVVHATTGKRDGEDEADKQQAAGRKEGDQSEPPDFDLPALAAVAKEVNAKAAAAAAAATTASSSSSSSPSPLPAVFLLTRPTPHALLLPQCDLALHHCGAGTTHATLCAGVPSLPLPCAHASDQPWWADVLRKIGAAPPRAKKNKGLPALAADLTPGAFAAALRGALAGFGAGGGGEGGGDSSSSPPLLAHADPYLSLKRSAERAGSNVRAEKGTARLVAELERVLAGPPSPAPPAPWGPF